MTAARLSGSPLRRNRWPRLPAVMAAAAVFLMVVAGGVAFWQLQPARYSANTTLVVLPAGSSAEAASYYDTLSRGQITTTFAEILALRASSDGGDTDVTVEVVPGTSLIQVTAGAESGPAAQEAADQALSRAEPYFDQLGAPYSVSVVQSAEDTAEQAGLPWGVLAAVVAAVALIAAFSAYLAVHALQQARTQARLLDGTSADDPGQVAGVTGPAQGSQRENYRATAPGVRNGNPPRRKRPAADRRPPHPAQ